MEDCIFNGISGIAPGQLLQDDNGNDLPGTGYWEQCKPAGGIDNYFGCCEFYYSPCWADPLCTCDPNLCTSIIDNTVDCATITGGQFEGCGDWNNVMNGTSPNTLPYITAHWYNILTAQGYQTLANGQPFTFANLQALLGGNPPTLGCCGPPATGQDLFGCTDPTAQNYSPLASVDDSSCCYVAGCWQ